MNGKKRKVTILLEQMRRLVLFTVLLGALAAPAASLAVRDALGDGSLVVKNGTAPEGTPVVALKIIGSVIGEVKGSGRIIIDAGVNGEQPEVAGATLEKTPKLQSDTAQAWSSPDGFKFRATGGRFTILIYGSKVNLVAVGKGWARLAGMPGVPTGDGKYSLNGDVDFHSLPGAQTDKLFFPAVTG
jgi:hypothetical protein